MAMRLKIIDLGAYPAGVPFKLALQCAYWSLRVRLVPVGSLITLNGTPLDLLSTGIVDPQDGSVQVSIDFPPLFDGTGWPVLWNETLVFNANGNALIGTVIMAIHDPATPESPRR